jgi:hypothetical protein
MVSETRELHGSGVGGTLKLVALSAVIALAVLGCLVVLEILPQSAFAAVSVKVLSLAAIAGFTSVAVWGLMRAGRRG